MTPGASRRLAALVRKEARQLLRDPANLAFALLLPIALILLFGYGITMDVRQAPVAIVLDDPSPAARDAVSGLARSEWIVPVGVPAMADAERLLLEHRVHAIVRVPADFEARRAAGDAAVQLVLHGSDAATARVVQSYVQAGLQQPVQLAADRAGGGEGADTAGPRIALSTRMWFNTANTSTWYLVPGLVVLIMTLVGAFLTSLLVAREWERGTMEALIVTPVRPLEILLAKMLPYFAVGLAGCLLCLAAARLLFGLPFQGSPGLLLLAAMLYLLVSLGMGLLVSSVARTQFLASQVALIVSFLPAMMLSGFIFDLRNVSPVVRAIANALPATHFLEVEKTLLLAGDVPSIVGPGLIKLALYAAGFLFAALAATRKRLD